MEICIIAWGFFLNILIIKYDSALSVRVRCDVKAEESRREQEHSWHKLNWLFSFLNHLLQNSKYKEKQMLHDPIHRSKSNLKSQVHNKVKIRAVADLMWSGATCLPGFWKIVFFGNIFGNLSPPLKFCLPPLNCLIIFIEKKYLISFIIK
jgi:hypothetical protein